MYYVYAIHSDDGRNYSGSTADFNRRLKEHNSGKCDSTHGGRWRPLFVLPFEDRRTAELVERWLKQGDTKKKRSSLVRAGETLKPETVAGFALCAAKTWQAKRSLLVPRGGF